MSDKGFAPRIYKDCFYLNSNNRNNSIKKWAKHLDRHFPKEDTQWKINIPKGAQHH